MSKKLRHYVLVEDTMFDYQDRTKKEKDRTQQLIKTKKETGICPDELWSLNYSIAVFLVPRLEKFIEKTIGYPGNFKTLDEWKTVLRKILYSMRKIVNNKTPMTEKEDPKFWKGMDLFHEYFFGLWW